MEYKNQKCGIYKIHNVNNGKLYIGLSTNIPDRWSSHRYELKRGTHANSHLQSSWIKNGESAFEFEVIEFCDKSQLEERELYWIEKLNSYKNGYNMLLGAWDYSNINTVAEEKPFYIFHRQSKEFLGEYTNKQNVAREFGIAYTSLSNSLANRVRYTGMHIFIYKDEYEDNGGYFHGEINSIFEDGFYIVDLVSGEYKLFYSYEYGASYFGIADARCIRDRVKNSYQPSIWGNYYFCNEYAFTDIKDILEKYSNLSFYNDCNILENIYSS